MRVLVIGGGGFLGSRTVQALARLPGVHVTVGQRRQLTTRQSRQLQGIASWTRVDLSDPSTFSEMKKHDVVLNTADANNDTTNDNVTFGDGTVSMAYTVVTSGVSCRGMVFFKSSSGTETVCPIISYNHFSANVTADGGTVTVTLNADGIFRASYD